jgi:predicted nucleotidyltransferase component of viral defense system
VLLDVVRVSSEKKMDTKNTKKKKTCTRDLDMEPVIFEAEFRRKKRHKKKIKKKETCTRDLDMELVIFDAALNTP